MFSSFRDRFGTAGLIVAVVALVAALGGSAYALTSADKKLIKKEAKKYAKKEAKKYAKQFAKPGAQGLPGTPGANGLPGAKGADGAQGPQGIQGPPGKEGKEGKPGKEGSPWTAGGTLPSEATLTGTFSNPKLINVFGTDFTGILSDGESYVEPVSFEIPLSSAPTATYVPPSGSNFGTAAGCPGVTAETPEAESGKFCVYGAPTPVPFASPTVSVTKSASGSKAEISGTGPAGAAVWVQCDTPEGAPVPFCAAAGVWAVTG